MKMHSPGRTVAASRRRPCAVRAIESDLGPNAARSQASRNWLHQRQYSETLERLAGLLSDAAPMPLARAIDGPLLPSNRDQRSSK